MKIQLIGLVFILMSCNGQKKVSVKNANGQSKTESSLVLLLQDEYAGFVVEETMVIRDQKRLRSFYSKINKTRKPGLSVPIIDFSKEMVIVQCAGEQNYDGLAVLTFNKETDTQVILNSDILRESEGTSDAIRTNLFCIYKVPVTEKEVLVTPNFK